MIDRLAEAYLLVLAGLAGWYLAQRWARYQQEQFELHQNFGELRRQLYELRHLYELEHRKEAVTS